MTAASGLTRNQSLVYRALSRSAEPLTAYGLLDRLRAKGLRAPLQVYRALRSLTDRGLVHRVESLNAFVACREPHPASGVDHGAAFAICRACGATVEFPAPQIGRQAATRLGRLGFHVDSMTIEVHGLCGACRGR